jgi:hypothetical protein
MLVFSAPTKMNCLMFGSKMRRRAWTTKITTLTTKGSINSINRNWRDCPSDWFLYFSCYKMRVAFADFTNSSFFTISQSMFSLPQWPFRCASEVPFILQLWITLSTGLRDRPIMTKIWRWEYRPTGVEKSSEPRKTFHILSLFLCYVPSLAITKKDQIQYCYLQVIWATILRLRPSNQHGYTHTSHATPPVHPPQNILTNTVH